MCFLMVHGVLEADFLSSFLIFFQESGNQVKKSGEKTPWISRRRKSALLTGKENV